jgi:hypothetical protein
MEAKNIIIGGLALAVVGGGAYFYFKNKSKKPFTQQLSDSLSTTAGVPATSSTSTSGSSTSASTPDKVLDTAPVTNAQAQANQQDTAKQVQAQGLANQVISLMETKKPTGGFPIDTQAMSFNMGVDAKILEIKNKMKDLGYNYDNGIAVKI